MKVLIAYDGSKSSDEALDDLQKAGLPDDVEALIVTAAEIWMPPPVINNGGNGNPSKLIPDWVRRHNKVTHAALKEAEALSYHARERVQNEFPGWKVSSQTASGSAAREILEKADLFCPDLIVIGAQGKNAVNHLFLGSVCGKVLSEAKCSVRVARAQSVGCALSPARIIIGFDCSPGANSAVRTVAAGNWHEKSEIRLVTVIDPFIPDSIGRFMTSSIGWVKAELKSEHRWIKKIAHSALLKIKHAGFSAELCVRDGNPKEILVEEAKRWNADSIFVGAHSFSNKTERLPLGTISAAVGERASCSVEIVRK